MMTEMTVAATIAEAEVIVMIEDAMIKIVTTEAVMIEAVMIEIEIVMIEVAMIEVVMTVVMIVVKTVVTTGIVMIEVAMIGEAVMTAGDRGHVTAVADSRRSDFPLPFLLQSAVQFALLSNRG